MLSIDGCGKSEIALFLQRKPNLDGLRGSARNSSAERVHNFPAVLTNN